MLVLLLYFATESSRDNSKLFAMPLCVSLAKQVFTSQLKFLAAPVWIRISDSEQRRVQVKTTKATMPIGESWVVRVNLIDSGIRITAWPQIIVAWHQCICINIIPRPNKAGCGSSLPLSLSLSLCVIWLLFGRCPIKKGKKKNNRKL